MNSAIFHRSLDKDYPEAAAGQGVFLVTSSGAKILDGSSGAAVSCLGHNNAEVIEAVIDQTRQLSFAHTHFFTSGPAEQLASLMLDASRGAFSKVSFFCSGSEAVESAIKIARQYHVYNGEAGRVNFIGRNYSYHGNTLGALALGNNPARRGTFAPILSPVFHHVSRCFYDADGRGEASEESYEDGLVAEFAAKVRELGPETVAAIVVEPVVGATLGAVPATRTYLPRLRKLCDEFGILLVFDEVMCGMGRVGSYHAWEQLGGSAAAPDLQTVGKGLGGGYQPLSAVLMAPRVSAVFEQHSKGASKFTSGHTFQGHVVACAGALTVQKILKRDNLLQNVFEMGTLLDGLLAKGLSPWLVKQGATVRGLGLFRAVDFGRAGAALGRPLAAEVGEETFKQGAAVYPCSPSIDAMLFAPPYIISAEEVSQLAEIFIRSLNHVIERRGQSVELRNGH